MKTNEQERLLVYKMLHFHSYNIESLENEVLASKSARLMFLYLYLVDDTEKDKIGTYILATKDSKYIHYLMRNFKIKNYKMYLDYVINSSDDACYLYNILYDLDYLDNDYRVNIISKIITIGDEKYIIEAIYYYFIILNLYSESLFNKARKYLAEYNVTITKKDYKEVLKDLNTRRNNIEDPESFSKNCFKGRNNYIPSIIVCHTNNTYASAIKHFYDDSSKVSSHYLIRRDGHIKQVVDLKDSAWANGTSLSEESDAYYEFAKSDLINSFDDNANYITFSIENESFDGTISNEQFESTIKVMKEIIAYVKEKYKKDFQVDEKHIIGHSNVTPILRTKCPGAKFPFKEIVERLKKEIGE